MATRLPMHNPSREQLESMNAGQLRRRGYIRIYPRPHESGWRCRPLVFERRRVAPVLRTGGWWTNHWPGVPEPPPSFACGRTGAFGGDCPYRGHTEVEVAAHHAARHDYRGPVAVMAAEPSPTANELRARYPALFADDEDA